MANVSAQAARVAKARHTSIASIQRPIAAGTQNRDLSFLGESRVNVLQLNLALDRRFGKH